MISIAFAAAKLFYAKRNNVTAVTELHAYFWCTALVRRLMRTGFTPATKRTPATHEGAASTAGAHGTSKLPRTCAAARMGISDG